MRKLWHKFLWWWKTPSFDYVSIQWIKEHRTIEDNSNPKSQSSLDAEYTA